MFRIRNGRIEADTVDEVVEKGYEKCDYCGGKRYNGCVHNRECSIEEYTKESLSWRICGVCNTTKERYNYDLVRYGMGRIC